MKRYPVHLIDEPTQADDVLFDNGDTVDIIQGIVKNGDIKCQDYTEKFAPHLRGKTVLETCGNIHEFIKTQIPYVLDPRGFQYIKSPGRLFYDKAGDCKSFSVFTASILKNLGIEYGYRFVSYKSDDATPTHVYIYVPNTGNEIIIDAVWSGPFNTQKTFAHKKDILMPKIMYLGTTEQHIAGVLTINKPLDELLEGELDLLLARQKLEIDMMNAEAIGGTWKRPGYQRSLNLVNHMLRNVDNPEVIMGIGERMQANPDAHVAGLGKFIKKVGKGIAKGAKAVVKVATLPMRMVGKGIMEIYLPKAAMMFLYLFTAPGVNLPDKMRRKREKAEKFKKFVCGKLGMKEAHFMSIIRNNLTKRFKQSPEAHLAAQLKKAGISGIGAAKKAKVNKQRKKATSATTSLSKPMQTILPGLTAAAPASVLAKVNNLATKAESLKESGGFIKDTINKAAEGNIIGAVIGAISWIIQKLGGKKEDALTADDYPDVEADSGNAFRYQDLQNDYSALDQTQRRELRDTAADLIDRDASADEARTRLNQVEYLNDAQREEMVEEVEAGYEPLTEQESNSLANQVKQGANIDRFNNGGGGGGYCNC